MSLEPRQSHDIAMERPVVGPEGLHHPSDDSGRGLLRGGSEAATPRVNQSIEEEQPYVARLEFQPENETTPLPPRHPSRQIMRWGPPTTDGYDDRYDRYDGYWDDRYDRRPQSRRSYDYPPSRHMYSSDRAQDLRMRRGPSVRDTPTKMRGGRPRPNPPGFGPRGRSEWHEMSDEESDEEPRKKTAARLRTEAGGERSSPPPEELLRLPFTMWMHSDAKNRKCCVVRFSHPGLTRYFRLRCGNWRVCGHNHVSVLRLRRNAGRQHRRRLW